MSHCGRFRTHALSRRELLQTSAQGFGALALSVLYGDRALASVRKSGARERHFPPRARNVIFLYMDGGPSQVDTFDPKPRLRREHGEPFKLKIETTFFNQNGNTLASPWKFRRYGECGLPVSDLFPNVGRVADELCVIRSMVSAFSEHSNANYFLHTGIGMTGRPSMGAWVSYGLGSENDDLPGFVVLNGGLIPPGGVDCFGSGFLPATHQGSILRPHPEAIANIRPQEPRPEIQESKLEFVRALDRGVLERLGSIDALESAIANHELAFRMQAAVPELMDLEGEPGWLKARYGIGDPFEPTHVFGTECLLARRLVERGVRFVQLTCPKTTDADRWDQHSRLEKNHAENARAVDRPIATLIEDLRSRGLLDETLVIWAGEFGRTPFAQGKDGRDHNPFGFSIWLAGGGVRGGHIHGATDEYGYKAVEDPVEIHDLHATLLALLGVDHTRLTVRFGGQEVRLTDVRGRVVREILA